jgi:predicted lipoprotein with Yx(FWY)xxD motif
MTRVRNHHPDDHRPSNPASGVIKTARHATTRLVFVGVALLAAACGSATAGSSSSGSTATVSTASIGSVGTVLVNSAGRTLYTPMQEASGQLMCTTSECNAIWIPLTVPSGTQPSAGSGVTVTLGTVTRPDGTLQVTEAGKPLYTFSLDTDSGQVTGNNVQDQFGSLQFTWTAATMGGAGAAPATATPAGAGASPTNPSGY